MKFGELTIAQILLSAFSGIAVFIISWILGKKIIGRFRNRDKQVKIIQKDNKVNGNMAGGNIMRTNTIHSIDTKRNSTKVDQSGNTVGGDMAGGNILKNKD
jgi:predicted small secreted protein